MAASLQPITGVIGEVEETAFAIKTLDLRRARRVSGARCSCTLWKFMRALTVKR